MLFDVLCFFFVDLLLFNQVGSSSLEMIDLGNQPKVIASMKNVRHVENVTSYTSIYQFLADSFKSSRFASWFSTQ